MRFERGDILLVEFDPTRGSEIKKTRPAVVVTNNLANQFSPVISVIPVTSQQLDKIRVFEVLLSNTTGLKKSSKAVIAQIHTVDKSRIQKKIGKVSKAEMATINEKLKIHFDLD